MTIPIAFGVFSSLIVLFYLILIGQFIHGWSRWGSRPSPFQKPHQFISVIVAFRNESYHLPNLLKHLAAQTYPPDLFEVILSDDFSEDQSRQIVREFTAIRPGFRLIEPLAGDGFGKKEALRRAVARARGDVIVTTDADCTMGKYWLHHISSGFGQKDIRLVIGPVAISYNSGGLFSRLQSLEFMSLVGSTGGSAGMGHPIMCNGANLAVLSDTLKDCMNEIKGQEYASGDDVFLLQAIHKRFPGKITFLKNKEAIVSTTAVTGIKAYINQRARWAGKSLGYTDGFTIATAWSVFLMNFLIVATAFAGIIYPSLWYFLLVFLMLKSIVDFILLSRVARFQGSTDLLILFPLMALIYPFYVVTTAFWSIFSKQAWKGRIMHS